MMKFWKTAIVVVLIILISQSNFGRVYYFHKPNIAVNNNNDCPTIDISNIVIKKPSCGMSNGSITGVIVNSSGTKKVYTWHNVDSEVGNSIDLENIPAGTYTLEFRDNSDCTSSVLSSKIVVDNANAIKMDESTEVTANENCNKSDGGITGIEVTGATNFVWTNVSTGKPVANSTKSPDLVNVPAGDYQLLAYNSTCQLMSKTYTIAPADFQVPKVLSFVSEDAPCGLDGSLSVTLNVAPGTPQLKYYFAYTDGEVVGKGGNGVIFGDQPNPVVTLANRSGDFNLYVTNDKGCRALLGTFTVNPAELKISHEDTKIVNDRCNQHLGAIEPFYTGGTPPKPVSQFTWTDLSTGKVVSTGKLLLNVGAGTYSIRIDDPEKCTAIDTFTIQNISPTVIPPKAAGTTLCLPGLITITVSNPDTAETFRLYDRVDATTPIETNTTGIFNKQIDQTTDYYLTRVHGDCESERTKVTETVLVSLKIPNTFTPNNDGVNDNWNLTGMDKFPGAEISIFTRDGQLIFHSINYPVAFDGAFNGKLLPTGVYYYLIDVKQPTCFGKIAGSLTIIR